jgi:hypothetical protein
MIKKTDIKNLFNNKNLYVEQHGAKQLFTVYDDNRIYLLSYKTIIGYLDRGTWIFDNHKYSRTTSKQLSYFKNLTCYNIRMIDYFDNALNDYIDKNTYNPIG